MIDGEYYVDGGVLNNFPVSTIKDECDIVIGVDVNKIVYKKMGSVIEMAERTFELVIWSNVRHQIGLCDIVIQPEKSIDYGFFEFKKYQEFYDTGYAEGKKMIPKILSMIEEGQPA